MTKQRTAGKNIKASDNKTVHLMSSFLQGKTKSEVTNLWTIVSVTTIKTNEIAVKICILVVYDKDRE